MGGYLGTCHCAILWFSGGGSDDVFRWFTVFPFGLANPGVLLKPHGKHMKPSHVQPPAKQSSCSQNINNLVKGEVERKNIREAAGIPEHELGFAINVPFSGGFFRHHL